MKHSPMRKGLSCLECIGVRLGSDAFLYACASLNRTLYSQRSCELLPYTCVNCREQEEGWEGAQHVTNANRTSEGPPGSQQRASSSYEVEEYIGAVLYEAFRISSATKKNFFSGESDVECHIYTTRLYSGIPSSSSSNSRSVQPSATESGIIYLTSLQNVSRSCSGNSLPKLS